MNKATYNSRVFSFFKNAAFNIGYDYYFFPSNYAL